MPTPEACLTVNHRLLGRLFFVCRASGSPVRVWRENSTPGQRTGLRADAYSLGKVAEVWIDAEARRLRQFIAREGG